MHANILFKVFEYKYKDLETYLHMNMKYSVSDIRAFMYAQYKYAEYKYATWLILWEATCKYDSIKLGQTKLQANFDCLSRTESVQRRRPVTTYKLHE